MPYEKLVEVFRRYEKAAGTEEKMSLRELADGIAYPSLIGYILKSTGLKPLMRPDTKRKSLLSDEEKTAIDRAFDIEMSATDIAYFIGVAHYKVQRRLSQKGKRPQYTSLFRAGRGNFLTYSLADRIYEATDLGFTGDEIAYLFDTDVQLVDHAVENRHVYGPKIRQAREILGV